MVEHFVKRNKLVNVAFKVLSAVGPGTLRFAPSPEAREA
jgi:hypothetical protein